MPWINTDSLSQLTDLIERSFDEWQKSLPQEMRNSAFVVSDPKKEGTGDTTRYAERIEVDEYASTRDEWDTAEEAKVQYGYEKDLTVKTVAKTISITKRMRVAWKEKAMLDKITSLVETVPNTMDLDLAHRLTFAFETSYTDKNGDTVDTTVGDGLSLISSAHTLTWSATTYSNLITWNPAFSKAALENAEKMFVEESYNNLGEKKLVKPNCIITTDDPNTINEVKELMKSTADVDTNNSGTFNVYGTKYKHTVSSRLATTATWAVDTNKRKYWFLASEQASDFYLSILENAYVKTPSAWNNWEDFASENWDYLAAGTYGIAIVSWKWIKWSKWDAS